MSEPSLQDLLECLERIHDRLDRVDHLEHGQGGVSQRLTAIDQLLGEMERRTDARVGVVRAEIAQLRADGGDRLRQTEERINARLDAMSAGLNQLGKELRADLSTLRAAVNDRR